LPQHALKKENQIPIIFYSLWRGYGLHFLWLMRLAIKLGWLVLFSIYVIRAGADTERKLINFLIIVGSTALGVPGRSLSNTSPIRPRNSRWSSAFYQPTSAARLRPRGIIGVPAEFTKARKCLAIRVIRPLCEAAVTTGKSPNVGTDGCPIFHFQSSGSSTDPRFTDFHASKLKTFQIPKHRENALPHSRHCQPIGVLRLRLIFALLRAKINPRSG
jgi:hypothetical protein